MNISCLFIHSAVDMHVGGFPCGPLGSVLPDAFWYVAPSRWVWGPLYWVQGTHRCNCSSYPRSPGYCPGVHSLQWCLRLPVISCGHFLALVAVVLAWLLPHVRMRQSPAFCPQVSFLPQPSCHKDLDLHRG